MLTFLSMRRGLIVEVRQVDRCPVVSPLAVAMTLGLIVMTPVCVRRHCQRRVGQIGLTGTCLRHGMAASKMTATGG